MGDEIGRRGSYVMEEKDRETRREKRGWKNIGAIGEDRGEQTIYIHREI